MNILLISNLYPPVFFGGYEILADQVAQGLRKRGHDVRVLTSGFQADAVNRIPEVARRLELTTPFPRPGESSQEVDFRLSTLHRVAARNQRITEQTLREASEWFYNGQDADVVFCWSLNRLTLGPVLAAQAQNVPVCQTVNDQHPAQFWVSPPSFRPRLALRSLAESLAYPKASLRRVKAFPVTFISEALKRSVLERHVPLTHGEVIHQGVPLDGLPFRPTLRSEGRDLELLYVGQLSRAKGVHTILRSLAGLASKGIDNIRLSIVGDGVPEYLQELKAIVRECALDDQVQFVGAVTRDQVPRFYQNHHALVFSSEWEEPFGLCHLESMASGCAVISTTTGGSAELIQDGQNALAYSAGDPEELGSRILELVRDEALRLRLIHRARRHVETHHSLDHYTAKLEDFLSRARVRAAPRSWRRRAKPQDRRQLWQDRSLTPSHPSANHFNRPTTQNPAGARELVTGGTEQIVLP